MRVRLLLAVLVVASLLPLGQRPAGAVTTPCDSRPSTPILADAVVDRSYPSRFLADVDGDGHKDVITGYFSGNADPDLARHFLHLELASGWGTEFEINTLDQFSLSPQARPHSVVVMGGRRLIVVGVQSTLVGADFALFDFHDCVLGPIPLAGGGYPNIWQGIGPTHSEWFACRDDRVEMIRVFAADEAESRLFPDVYPSGEAEAFRFDGLVFRLAGAVDLDLPRPAREVHGEFPDCSVFVGTFVDDGSSVFQPSIEWLAYEGITKGCNPPVNDRYCPVDQLTRGEMAAFLVRAMGYTDDGGGDLFVDDDGSVFEAAIDKLGTAGVTRGCNPPVNDRFCPDRRVTRGELAAFLVRAMGYTDDGGGNLFVDDDGSMFESSIDRLGAAGVTAGCNPPVNDRFCPDDYVTRGQVAAFLIRALG